MSLRHCLSLAALVCATAPALAQSPGQPPNPVVSGTTVNPGAAGGAPISMTPKDVEDRKVEYARSELSALKTGLKLDGAQEPLWTAFETRALATIPSSFKYLRAFCVDPTGQEGRGSFGATAKRLGVVADLMRGREAELNQVEASLTPLKASFTPDQQKAFGTLSSNLIKVLTTVPFGMPDTGLPFTCTTVNPSQTPMAAPKELPPELMKAMQAQQAQPKKP